VIFTAALQDYADWVLNSIDPDGTLIQFRLYRQHTSQRGPFYEKHLGDLGRDIAKTIIVDNMAENFAQQTENGILIKSWYNDPDDRVLAELIPILVEIAHEKVEDVRTVVVSMREQMKKQIAQGNPNPHLHLSIVKS
jgi:CTD small phosphatase-like protein 2